MNIYVKNLSFKTKDADLQNLFNNYGKVVSCKIIKDRETNRSRGFAFVEMDEQGGNNAIAALNGKEFEGRNLSVQKAKDKN